MTSGGPGSSSGYYIGILQYNDSIGYFLTTQYTNNPNPSGYYDYYYSGSGWGLGLTGRYLNYYFLEDNNGNTNGYSGLNYFAFMPPDQHYNQNYQYGVFWLYNWFQAGNGNMNIFFLMNGNIYNYSLALEQYIWDSNCWLFGCSPFSAYAIPPNPPASTINGEPIFAQSYINAYNTAFNQPVNRQNALSKYLAFTFSDVNSNFIPGTFGYAEGYTGSIGNSQASITIHKLQMESIKYLSNNYTLF